MRYLMMMVGAVEVVGALINWVRNRPARRSPASARSLIAGAIGLIVLVIFGFVFQMLPGGGKIGDQYVGADPLEPRHAGRAATAGRRTTSRATSPSRCTPSTTTSCRR